MGGPEGITGRGPPRHRESVKKEARGLGILKGCQPPYEKSPLMKKQYVFVDEFCPETLFFIDVPEVCDLQKHAENFGLVPRPVHEKCK